MKIKWEEKTKNALLWITEILNKHNIPFQISGGLSAKLYGSPRPLNDIDIDIPEEGFKKIINDVKEYIIFGPKQYIDKKWDLKLMTLNYFGQKIDIGGTEYLKIFDSKNNKWLPFSTNFKKVVWLSFIGIKLPIIPAEELIKYKTYLDGDHQQIDINAVQKYVQDRPV
ncbi:MAG: MazG-related protein [Candidatus Paceibacterota bacterium]